MLPARSSDESCGWAGAIGIWHGLGCFSDILDGCPKGDNSGDGSNPRGGEERQSQYISHIEVCAPPPSGGVFVPFWSENAYTLCSFSSGIGCGFRENLGVYERIYRFNSKWVRKKEKYANSKWIWIIVLFALNNLSTDSNFCLKARSENGYGF